MRKSFLFILSVILIPMLAGCFQKTDGPDMEWQGYMQISQEEAVKMMAEDDGHVIVDVRTLAEYESGHIPGAICIPNEEIMTEMPDELPDKEQIILIYCRSGRRSKEAAGKLSEMGYVNIYEFGGIIDWTGETVMSEEETSTSGSLASDPESSAETEESYEFREEADLAIRVNGYYLIAEFENNSSAAAFLEKLKKEGKITVKLHDYGNFEKVGPLPWKLPANDTQITTTPGDIILYQGDQITIYYDTNTWSFTKLAHISGMTTEELKEILGKGDVEVIFTLDWKEY